MTQLQAHLRSQAASDVDDAIAYLRGEAGGTVALAKIGSGMQALNSNNSYTGGTTVKAGTLFATAGAGGSAFGSGPITIGDTGGGATAAVQVTNIGRTFTNAITVAAGSSGSRSLQTSGDGQDFVFSGPITLNSSLVVNTFTGNTNTLTLSGAMTGSSPLFVNAGGGTITFTGPITSVPTVTKTGTGKLLIDTVLGSGSTIVNADEGETHFAQSQALAALYIANGALVTVADVPPTPPSPDFGDAGLLAPAGGSVPEPGSLSLLAFGALALLRRRR